MQQLWPSSGLVASLRSCCPDTLLIYHNGHETETCTPNYDGVVDAADFTVWQDNLGLAASVLNGNGSGAATVVQADYLLWKTNFEALATGSEGTAAVPEPTTLLLALIGLSLLPLWRRR